MTHPGSTPQTQALALKGLLVCMSALVLLAALVLGTVAYTAYQDEASFRACVTAGNDPTGCRE